MSRKLSFEEVKGVLGPGQEYLQDYLRTAPDPVGIYEHSRPTKTCKEKIELLNAESGLTWKLEQAVRAVYFKGSAGFIYMVVTPDYDKGRIETTPCVGRTLGLMTELPTYVEQGTCTPFIPDWDISRAAGRVQRFYVQEDARLDQILCDFSIGGRGPEAQKRSLRMYYGTAVKMLKETFGELVTVQDIYTMPSKEHFTPGKKVLIQAPDKVKA